MPAEGSDDQQQESHSLRQAGEKMPDLMPAEDEQDQDRNGKEVPRRQNLTGFGELLDQPRPRQR